MSGYDAPFEDMERKDPREKPQASEIVKPLNPRLYHVLQQQFGEVQIASEGEAFVGKPIVQNGRRSYEVLSSGEYYKVCCPFCREGRFRLWVNHRFGVPDDWTKSNNQYLAVCYNEDCTASPANRQWLYLHTIGLMHLRQGEKPQILKGSDDGAVVMPSSPPGKMVSLLELPITHPANLYLEERGYDARAIAEEFSLAHCYETTDVRYSLALDRIVAPIYQQGMMAGWQCRYIGDLDWKHTGIPKYFTKPGMPKRLLLYNYDNAKKHDVVVVCEGISDVWSVGPMAVAVLGKKLHQRQKNLLMNTWGHGLLVLMLDQEVYEQMEGLVPELQDKFAYGVLPVRLPGKDPGSFDREFNRQLILSAAHTRGVQIPDSFFVQHDS